MSSHTTPNDPNMDTTTAGGTPTPTPAPASASAPTAGTPSTSSVPATSTTPTIAIAAATAASVATTIPPPHPASTVAGGAPARVYMNEKITPYLLEGMKLVVREQPSNPLRVLGEYLIQKSGEVEGRSGGE